VQVNISSKSDGKKDKATPNQAKSASTASQSKTPVELNTNFR